MRRREFIARGDYLAAHYSCAAELADQVAEDDRAVAGHSVWLDGTELFHVDFN
jgi:hypothetical protein